MIRIVSGFFFFCILFPDLLILYVQKYRKGGMVHSQFFMEYLLGAMPLGWIQQTQFLPSLSSTKLWGYGGVSALGGNIQVFLEQVRRAS